MGTKKMIAVTAMEERPRCMDCRFRWPGDRGTYCLALSHKIPRGWYLHHIVVAKHTSYRTWREPACPLVEIEHTEDAYWWPDVDRDFVFCSGCQSEFSKASLHEVADYDDEYPCYCPQCGARMLNCETGEILEEVL